MRTMLTGAFALILTALPGASAAEPAKPLPAPPPLPALPKDAPKLARDITVMLQGSSVCFTPAKGWYRGRFIKGGTLNIDRLPPQCHQGETIFYRVFEMLNDHENMCWRRFTDGDWTKGGEWPEFVKLPYIEQAPTRVCWETSSADAWAELKVPAGYEKLDLIYTSDPNGDKIKVSIDGQAPAENALVNTRQETKIPKDAPRGSEVETLDSHGEPLKMPVPTWGIPQIFELRARYRIDPAKEHVFRIQKASADPAKRIMVWGAVYWRGNCIQVVNRAKCGINCGDLPRYSAIQETMALKPDYVLMEAINMRGKAEQIPQTLEPGLAWCSRQKAAFKTLVFACPMASSKAFRKAYLKPEQEPVADACVAGVAELCRKYGFPLVDVGPEADAWLEANPKARFTAHIIPDWYHPNLHGAALFGKTIGEGIRKNWPELPVRPITVPAP